MRRIHTYVPGAVLLGVMLLKAAPAAAYVDLAPTLGRVVNDSQWIALVEVDRFSREKGIVILKSAGNLKGSGPADPIRHQVAGLNGVIPRPILEWAEPGRRGVLFGANNTALMCIGRSWYQVQAAGDGWWRLGPARPELPLAYCGTVSRLSSAVQQMLAGKTAIITSVPHGEEGIAASFDLALNRTNLPGLVKLQRQRASLNMPQQVMAASGRPGYVVGPGPVGENEIPALIARLASADATTRAETADDLRTLGAKAAAAVEPLTRLLDDPSAMVRMSAAAALCRIAPGRTRAVDVLSGGLASQDAVTRRNAVRAVAVAGPSASAFAARLAALLGDSDELTRLGALQAIATLGRAAAGACDAVTKLLDDPQMAIDAADALGRMGPAARPAQKRLAQMLSDESAAVRWAAVRAMSQIGGEEAAPAVQFMMRALPHASDLDGYNMMIYLALLGPVAKDAIPAVQSSGVRQPALKPATIWAIEPDRRFPWLGGGGRFGGGMQGDVVQIIYQAYVAELGEHLKPSARALAEMIMAGRAGDVPMWGYSLLARFPEEVLPILSPGLSHPDMVQRERAAVALGYMGPAAAPAKDHVALAVANAPTEREQRLIRWCLRQISAAPDVSMEPEP